ncbi:hypothetical protein ACL02R_25780 [Streptomyces sp. MS19]|uniref:hypothetical protein n=1 Tax=Streptomyces sp. MS19 TaxID=3385972 RepID=UPI0039A1F2C7
MTDDRFWPPEPAPVRDPNPEITVITGLEGALPRPAWRGQGREIVTLPPRCMYCEATTEDLVAVARTPVGDGRVHWTSHACTPCRIGAPLVPLAAHPSGSRGGLHYWPHIVPRELVVRLAELGDAPHLKAVSDRLFPAVAVAASRTVDERERGAAASEAEAAVAALWAAVPDHQP